jgi:serine/threonine-protein kinase
VLYVHQTALALDKMHAAGIVHRDLKPDNLFVTYRDEGSACVKLLDFGLAKLVIPVPLHSVRAFGTPVFMAPEQIRGEGSIGPYTDLFALGHIAYALLVGEPYWQEEVDGNRGMFWLFSKIVTGLPEAPVARARRRRGVVLPAAFDGWMRKAVAVRHERRFDRAPSQVTALAEALSIAWPSPAGQKSVHPPPGASDRPVSLRARPSTVSSRRLGSALALVAMVVVIAGGSVRAFLAQEPTRNARPSSYPQGFCAPSVIGRMNGR